MGSILVREDKDESRHCFFRASIRVYPPWLRLARLDVIGRDESAESDRLYQARFAHKSLIQQIAHDFQ
jgi:hypothetical protein